MADPVTWTKRVDTQSAWRFIANSGDGKVNLAGDLYTGIQTVTPPVEPVISPFPCFFRPA